MGCFIKRLEPRVEMEFGRLYQRRGGLLFMCGRENNERHCLCGDFGDYLCDYPVGEGKTCDVPMCERDRHSVAPEIDYCNTHYPEWEAFKKTGAPLKHFERVIPFRSERSYINDGSKQRKV